MRGPTGLAGAIAVLVAMASPAAAGGLQPTINPIPVLPADPGKAVVYDVVAEDPEGTALTFSLIEAGPYPDGIFIDPQTGRVTWTPDSSHADSTFFVFVMVSDSDEPTSTNEALLQIDVGSDTTTTTLPPTPLDFGVGPVATVVAGTPWNSTIWVDPGTATIIRWWSDDLPVWARVKGGDDFVEVSGTPMVPGRSYVFTVSGTNGASTGSIQYQVVVVEPPPATTVPATTVPTTTTTVPSTTSTTTTVLATTTTTTTSPASTVVQIADAVVREGEAWMVEVGVEGSDWAAFGVPGWARFEAGEGRLRFAGTPGFDDAGVSVIDVSNAETATSFVLTVVDVPQGVAAIVDPPAQITAPAEPFAPRTEAPRPVVLDVAPIAAGPVPDPVRGLDRSPRENLVVTFRAAAEAVQDQVIPAIVLGLLGAWLVLRGVGGRPIED